ncbi:uncharacterized protein V1510DRAFT_413651 [Dipodascopsis tothii]|uniref:uncharacterized protein n=1 Tax=Dipodascopsis tothii TaxID=44089 RepID=UPI0034CE7CB1
MAVARGASRRWDTAPAGKHLPPVAGHDHPADAATKPKTKPQRSRRPYRAREPRTRLRTTMSQSDRIDYATIEDVLELMARDAATANGGRVGEPRLAPGADAAAAEAALMEYDLAAAEENASRGSFESYSSSSSSSSSSCHSLDDISSRRRGLVPAGPKRPAMPDLRFEQAYLASLETAQGSAVGVAAITLRDQVVIPFAQGFLWAFAMIGFRTWKARSSENGAEVGAMVRQFVRGLRYRLGRALDEMLA